MREITAYEANDGSRFFDRAACLKHEQALFIVANALSGLKPCPNLTNGTYIRQNIDAVWAARTAIIKAANLSEAQKTPVLAKCETRTLPNHANVGMFLDGSDPICSAWRRLDCIDAEGREWDQVYYALNPSEGVGEHKPD